MCGDGTIIENTSAIDLIIPDKAEIPARSHVANDGFGTSPDMYCEKTAWYIGSPCMMAHLTIIQRYKLQEQNPFRLHFFPASDTINTNEKGGDILLQNRQSLSVPIQNNTEAQLLFGQGDVFLKIIEDSFKHQSYPEKRWLENYRRRF